MLRTIWNQYRWWFVAARIIIYAAFFILLDALTLPATAATKEEMTELVTYLRWYARKPSGDFAFVLPTNTQRVYVSYTEKKQPNVVIIFHESVIGVKHEDGSAHAITAAEIPTLLSSNMSGTVKKIVQLFDRHTRKYRIKPTPQRNQGLYDATVRALLDYLREVFRDA